MNSKKKMLVTLDSIELLRNTSPQKTLFIPQYFFIENTSLPLVISNYLYEIGYEPALAKAWYRPDPKTWEIVVKKNLKFSDGSPLTLEYIYHEIKSIQKKESMHLNFIYDAKITLDKKKNAIFFRFPYPLQDEFLFELSLADLSILHPKNKKGDWTVTSGAYFLKKETKEKGKKVWILEKNPYFPLHRPKMISKIKIYDLNFYTFFEDFKKLNINFLRASPSLMTDIPLFRKTAEKTWTGFPITSRYFYFCENPIPLSKNKKARKAFSRIVYEAVATIQRKNFHPDNQILPKGAPARIIPYEPTLASLKEMEVLKKQPLSIVFDYSWSKSKALPKAMVRIAKKYGITIKPYIRPHSPKGPFFAREMMYMTDQKDPISIWSFMIKKKAEGPFRCLNTNIEKKFNKLIKKHSRQVRWFHLQKLHEYVLKNYFLIPFAFEGVEYYTNSNISLDAFNPFDMHPRYYEIFFRSSWFPF